MTKPMTIDAAQTRHKATTGEALLVCAYDDEAYAHELRLDGALTLAELQEVIDEVESTREIVLYDAGLDDRVARQRAEQLRAKGFENARVLGGGVAEWKKAGFPLAAETPPQNPRG